jgi:hypothetical protein
MEHVRALILKVLMIGVITMLVLSLFRGIRPADSIAIAIVITLVAYVLGDLLILPAYGNIAASVSNGLIAFLIAWLTPFVTTNIPVTFGNALVVGILVGVGEWFFHKYVAREVLDYEKRER